MVSNVNNGGGVAQLAAQYAAKIKQSITARKADHDGDADDTAGVLNGTQALSRVPEGQEGAAVTPAVPSTGKSVTA